MRVSLWATLLALLNQRAEDENPAMRDRLQRGLPYLGLTLALMGALLLPGWATWEPPAPPAMPG